VIRLHSEGWSVTSIASYLVTSRHTVYDTLQRWADEGIAGLDAKPKTNKGVRKATLKIKSEVLRGVLGRTFPEEVLSRALYATQFTRQIDRHGFVKFKHWRLYGELGLAGEDVSVWVYEGNLKVEYQATALALYELSIEKDTGKIAKVTSARRLETHFRSAQLDLWQISDTEWLLALRRPEPAARKKAGKIVSLVEQLVLPEFGATG
jgi:transposase